LPSGPANTSRLAPCHRRCSISTADQREDCTRFAKFDRGSIGCITPQRATPTASFTSNIADLCRVFYTTQHSRLSRVQVRILYNSNRQQRAMANAQDGRDFASLAQWEWPTLGIPGKHPGSTTCCSSHQHYDASFHVTALPQPGQSHCASICKPNHNSYVQASMLALVYTICSFALLLCAAYTGQYPMCQRYMLSLQGI
jgi:hypothetical protein